MSASAPVPIEMTSKFAAFGAAVLEIIQLFAGIFRPRLLDTHGAMPPPEFGTEIPPGSPVPSLPATDGSTSAPVSYRKLSDKGVLE